MNDNNENDRREAFNRNAVIMKVNQGAILVKQNIFGGLKVVGKPIAPKVVTDNSPEYEEVEVIKDEELVLRILSDQQLTGLYSRVNDAQKLLIDNEKRFRAGLISDTPEMQNASIKVKRKVKEQRVRPRGADIIIERIKAKTGIKIRWFWESWLVLSTTDYELDTPSISMLSSDNTTTIEIDTDYAFKIVDPKKYVIKLNGLGGQSGVLNPSQALKKYISRLLDSLIKDYVRSHDYEEISNKVNLLTDLSYPLAKIEQEYGIDVTRFSIESIHPPKELTDAKMAQKTAEANAAAKRAEEQVKIDILTEQIEKYKDAGLSSKEIANILAMQGAKNATLLNIPNMFGGPVPNQGTPSSDNNPNGTPTPAPTNSDGQNTSSGTMDEKSIAIWSTMGFCDEDGCLSRDDSKAIMVHRGQQLAPGRVLMIYELNTEELQILKQLVIDREQQNQNHR